MGCLTLDHGIYLHRVHRQLLYMVWDRQEWRTFKAVYHQVCRACICLYLRCVDSGGEYMEGTISYCFSAYKRWHMAFEHETKEELLKDRQTKILVFYRGHI